MASAPLAGGTGGGGGTGDGSSEKQHHRWTESKVYTRKSHGKGSKISSNSNSQLQQQQNQQPPVQSQQAPPSIKPNTEPADLSSTRPVQAQPPPSVQLQPVQVSDDEASSLNHGVAQGGTNGLARNVTINLSSKSRQELRELRRRLTAELEQVRSLSKRLEAATAKPAPDAGYTQSQFSATNQDTPVARQVSTKRASEILTPVITTAVTATPVTASVSMRRQLSVSVSATETLPTESLEKEKRTPKANQLYRNSEFLLGKDKIPPPDSHKKSKANGSKKHSLSGEGDYSSTEKKIYASAFKKCSVLLSKLMKHKFSWVFNTPVDPDALGLHDYFAIIKHPMDLGTIKTRLSKNWYKSPREYAEDVRLTFRNAMTYNPKGQDVHFMAEQLSQIFEEQWSAIESEILYLSYPPTLPKKPVSAPLAPPPAPLPVDTRLERSDSTVHPAKPVNYTPHIGRALALKKPKAKDPHKRDMTFEEKRKLSNNLQNLPAEKLDVIVQIIKRKNLSLSQHDDEIEVDIDSMDVETLWELDRFVTNYKKNLSKNKRKAELAMQAQKDLVEQNASQSAPERVQEPVAGEEPNKADENYVASSVAPPVQDENKGENASRSSSTSSSSSESGSSSSDSDSDSSSAYGSDAAQSP